MQYPIKLMAWRNTILPPRNFTLSVNATPPNATVANTTENIVPASELVFDDDDVAKHTPNRRTNSSGPYKSQSRKGALLFCVVEDSPFSSSSRVLQKKQNTRFASSTFHTFDAIRSTSRLNVLEIDSSNVDNVQFTSPKLDRD